MLAVLHRVEKFTVHDHAPHTRTNRDRVNAPAPDHRIHGAARYAEEFYCALHVHCALVAAHARDRASPASGAAGLPQGIMDENMPLKQEMLGVCGSMDVWKPTLLGQRERRFCLIRIFGRHHRPDAFDATRIKSALLLARRSRCFRACQHRRIQPRRSTARQSSQPSPHGCLSRSPRARTHPSHPSEHQAHRSTPDARLASAIHGRTINHPRESWRSES